MRITLTAMRKHVKEIEDSVVVVTIITDGMENASHEYNGQTIKELVERLRGKGWTFTYMGSNQNSVEAAMKLSIRNSRLSLDWRSDDSYYNTQYISRSVTYYTYYDEGGYLKTSDGKKTITDIKWIAKPLGMDSLICYSDGKKRGYFNMLTGKPVIEPQYDHAWIFSDGLASVDDDGWIKFIDTSGKVVIDPKIPYMAGTDGYVFHNDRCIIHNDRRDRFGMIDKQGKWVLKPEYFSIYPFGKYWVIDNGIGKSVLRCRNSPYGVHRISRHTDCRQAEDGLCL